MNFNDYFSLSKGEKKATVLGKNTGDAHHQRALAGTNLKRKKAYLVGKKYTEKKHEHPKITICLNTKKDTPLSPAEAMQIMKSYAQNGIPVSPTPDEPSKAIKQTGVHLVLISPNVYILSYKGESNGKS